MGPLHDVMAGLPGVVVDMAQLEAHVGACMERGGHAEHLPDIVLAFAAATGDSAAVRLLGTRISRDIEAAARRIDRDAAFVDDVRQSVHVRLLVADGGTPTPRIASYHGRGPLGAWVHIAATRVALNLKRSLRAAPDTADVLEDLASGEPDPELRHLKGLYRGEFREALEASIAALSERERALLRLTYVDGLKLAQIGRLYNVHESTASRWLARAVARVGESARKRLVARLSLSKSAVDSVARMVQSQLDLSIARILDAPTAK
jgi:RNA polymerase sigma-70 factor (ECF subfamily)